MRFYVAFICFIAFAGCTTLQPIKTACDERLAKMADATEFFTHMPKGADLHSHIQGATYAEDLIGYAKIQRYFYDLKSHSVSLKQTKDTVRLEDVATKETLRTDLLKAWSAY